MLLGRQPPGLARAPGSHQGFAPGAGLRQVAARSRRPTREPRDVHRNDVPAEQAGARADAPIDGGEARGLDRARGRLGLQHRRRAVLDPLDASEGAPGSDVHRRSESDISEEVLRVAENGVYGPQSSEFVDASVFERLTEREERELFDWEGDQAQVKPWLREGITWRVGRCFRPGARRRPRPSGHRGREQLPVPHGRAERGALSTELRAAGGSRRHLFVAGVDLDLRTRVAVELGWKPVEELTAEIHEGDPSVRGDWWPWEWWALEPLDRKRPDWQTRYASVFQIGSN